LTICPLHAPLRSPLSCALHHCRFVHFRTLRFLDYDFASLTLHVLFTYSARLRYPRLPAAGGFVLLGLPAVVACSLFSCVLPRVAIFVYVCLLRRWIPHAFQISLRLPHAFLRLRLRFSRFLAFCVSFSFLRFPRCVVWVRCVSFTLTGGTHRLGAFSRLPAFSVSCSFVSFSRSGALVAATFSFYISTTSFVPASLIFLVGYVSLVLPAGFHVSFGRVWFWLRLTRVRVRVCVLRIVWTAFLRLRILSPLFSFALDVARVYFCHTRIFCACTFLFRSTCRVRFFAPPVSLFSRLLPTLALQS